MTGLTILPLLRRRSTPQFCGLRPGELEAGNGVPPPALAVSLVTVAECPLTVSVRGTASVAEPVLVAGGVVHVAGQAANQLYYNISSLSWNTRK